MNTLFMFPMFVQIFADMKTNTTTQTGDGKDLSAEMKT